MKSAFACGHIHSSTGGTGALRAPEAEPPVGLFAASSHSASSSLIQDGSQTAKLRCRPRHQGQPTSSAQERGPSARMRSPSSVNASASTPRSRAMLLARLASCKAPSHMYMRTHAHRGQIYERCRDGRQCVAGGWSRGVDGGARNVIMCMNLNRHRLSHLGICLFEHEARLAAASCVVAMRGAGSHELAPSA